MRSRAQQYNAFGSTALLLNLIPVVNYVLNLGCAAGAALWAADVEVLIYCTPGRPHTAQPCAHGGTASASSAAWECSVLLIHE